MRRQQFSNALRAWRAPPKIERDCGRGPTAHGYEPARAPARRRSPLGGAPLVPATASLSHLTAQERIPHETPGGMVARAPTYPAPFVDHNFGNGLLLFAASLCLTGWAW